MEGIKEYLNYQIQHLEKWDKNKTLSEYGKGKLSGFKDILEQLRIGSVSQQRELLEGFEVGDEVEVWGNTFAKILRVKLTGYVCEDLRGFTFLVDDKDVKERSL
jgi:hypothetical protein